MYRCHTHWEECVWWRFHTIINCGKSKDTKFARHDLEVFGIMKDLWLRGTRKPRAKYCLIQEQLKLLCSWVRKVQVLEGYFSKTKRCVKVPELKFHDMMSHDFLWTSSSWCVQNNLCGHIKFFWDICLTTLPYDLSNMEKNVVDNMD